MLMQMYKKLFHYFVPALTAIIFCASAFVVPVHAANEIYYNVQRISAYPGNINLKVVDSEISRTTIDSHTSTAGLHFSYLYTYNMDFMFTDNKPRSGYFEFRTSGSGSFQYPSSYSPGVTVYAPNISEYGRIYIDDVSNFTLYFSTNAESYPGYTLTQNTCYWTIVSFVETPVDDISTLIDLYEKLRNYNIPLYSVPAYSQFRDVMDPSNFSTFNAFYFSPYMPVPGNFSEFDSRHYIGSRKGMYYLFYSSDLPSNLTFYTQDGNALGANISYVNQGYGTNQIVMEFTRNANFTLSTRANQFVVPVYIGYLYNCPDDVLRIFGLDGNSAITESINNLDPANENFDSAATDYMDIESDFMSNVDDSLDDIDLTDGHQLLSNNKFISSAQWVATQYQNLINGNPFELVLMFCLVLGLAMIFIGKVR